MASPDAAGAERAGDGADEERAAASCFCLAAFFSSTVCAMFDTWRIGRSAMAGSDCANSMVETCRPALARMSADGN